MSSVGFSNLGGAWLLLLFVPLIIFYFLKLKRPRKEIPSLALWQQVMNDQRVNSPFQRFKRNLLLLLQAIVLAGIILAAMQPFILRAPDRTEFLPVLIDCSASMGALREPGGTTPLDDAKERVRELIDGLRGDQKISLIAVHSSARRLTDFTDNTRILHDALNSIAPSDLSSDAEDALRMTGALARSHYIPSVLLYSDGNLPANTDVELPFELKFQRVASGGRNVGITEINASRSGPTEWDVFARLEVAGTESAGGTLELSQDGTTISRETIFLQPKGSQRVGFRVNADAASSLKMNFIPDGFDSLTSDNVAFLELPRARPLYAHVAADLPMYRQALEAIKGVEIIDSSDNSPTGTYDLYVSDSESEEGDEAAVSLYVGVTPPELADLVTIETGYANIVDWQRASELLQHVQLNDVLITDKPQSQPSVQDQAFEELGYEIMAHSQSGPLILKKRNGVRVAFYMLFHTDHSTLPYRVGFPILVSNLVQIARQQASLSEVRGVRTGVLPEIPLLPEHDYRVVSPDGSDRVVKSDNNAILAGIGAESIGTYEVRDDGKVVKQIGASLLSSLETTLDSAEKLQLGEVAVAAATADVPSDYPLWRWLAMGAFCVAIGEWWCFQRRPGGWQ